MARKKSDELRENGIDPNPYSYATSPRVSDYLESTQLNKFGTKGGTGFAAEDVNALHDSHRGVNVDKVGTNNAKNGADRIANGLLIQTKYFDSASKSVENAFDSVSGQFRYPGMQLEVPRDQYETALNLMRKKISDGKVPGISNPDDALKIVKQGSVTFQQAKNIARAGNIDSLKFDANNNAVTSSYAFAIGFAINFAKAKWEGKSNNQALKESVETGLVSAGTSFIAGVTASQMLRTHLARSATITMREGVRVVAKTDVGRIMVNKIASASTGKTLSGAAATNHASKLLRTNLITGTVVSIVLTGPDIYRAAISQNASWTQAGKNLVVNGAGVAAGTIGWMGGAAGGAAIGTAIFPGVGTTIGTVIGGLVGATGGGSGGAYLVKKSLDGLIDDDTIKMLKLIETELVSLADEYLLTQGEFDIVLKKVSEDCTAKFLREVYANKARDNFLRARFEPYCHELIVVREPVILPVFEDVLIELDTITLSG